MTHLFNEAKSQGEEWMQDNKKSSRLNIKGL